jgi:uridine phosphorylase
MQYPNFKNKHLEKTMIEPVQYIEYMKERGKFPSSSPPKGVILCYQRTLLDFIKNNHKHSLCDGFLPGLLFLEDTKNEIAVIGGFGIGSPSAAIILEELIAFGVKEFISMGTAGTLQPNVQIGDLVLCDRAIRDEGTSHHYLQTGKYSYPSSTLTKKFGDSLTNHGAPYIIGTTWTVDAPYRETMTEARHYQSEGTLTVEMEASALFAVAEFRRVPLAAAFTISDSLADLRWQPEFHSSKTQQGLEKLYQAAIAAF